LDNLAGMIPRHFVIRGGSKGAAIMNVFAKSEGRTF
jgi:hypothetical protein